MKNLHLLIITLFLTSCFLKIDDTDNVCTENCTTFKGRIKTVDNIGLSNIKVSFAYQNHQELSGIDRKIGKTKTDNNGYYKMSVFLKDSEIQSGFFILSIDYEEVSSELTDEYLRPDVILMENPEIIFSEITDRNQTFSNDFIIPKKGVVEIQLHNFNPIITSDYFNVHVKYYYAFLNHNWITHQSWDGIYTNSSSSETVLRAEAVVGDDVRIIVNKQKNGIKETFEQLVQLNSQNNLLLEFDY